MSIFTNPGRRRNSALTRESEADNIQFNAMVRQLTEELSFERMDNADLRESMQDLSRAVEDMGWKPLGSVGYGDSGMDLEAIRRCTETTRPLYAANPLVKRGIRARIGYIWGEGVTVTGRSVSRIVKANAAAMFSRTAQGENEAAAATDGNVVFHLSRRDRKMHRIPLAQIGEYVVDPDHPDVKWFVKRVWSISGIDVGTGQRINETKEVWYPTLDYVDASLPIPVAIGGTPVEQAEVIHVITFNRQIGWLWGVPDLLPAIFWSRAYKEFLESHYTLVRSLARFAFKVTDTRPSGSAAKRAAIKIAAPQNVDPTTGQRSDAGAVATMGQGVDLLAVNKAGANVDFEAGKPLAAMVASAMEVPLTTILSESSAATDEALDMPTVKSAQARQEQWAENIVRMLEYLGGAGVKVQFPPIQAAPIHRVVQAIVTAASAGVLFPAEVRDLIVKAMHGYGIEPRSGLPEPGEWKQYVTPQALNPGTSPQQTPDDTGSAPDGQRTPAGAQADGDHEMRPTE